MDALDRLYWHLVETLRRDGAAAEGALTVARLYQNLIPYRGVRAELGLLELAQYEHALLRLLSGERGYLVLEPADVQGELRRELGSPNPILGIYRDYSDVGVQLQPPRREPVAPAPGAAPAPEVAAPRATAPPAPVAASAVVACTSCREALPRGRDARFCPFCGTAQPYCCRQCGETLASQWRFCIDCGEPREVESTPPSRA